MASVAKLTVDITANKKDFDNKIREADKDVKTFGQKMQGALGNVAKVAAPVAIGIGAIATDAVQSAIRFESSFANVRKTVSGTDAELDALQKNIRWLATKTDLGSLDDSANTLADIAALGGQLGVATSDLLVFTRTVGAMTVATDLSAEAAANFAARFANITGMPITEIENLADAIVTLGNNSATNESSIAETALRLASLASMNFDVDEILGLAAAIPSLGLSPELGATNVFKTITDMVGAVSAGGSEMQAWADAIGVMPDKFKEMVTNDPSAAFVGLLESLSTMDSSTALQTLNNIGITAPEQQRVIMTLASGIDTVKESMENAEDAYKGNGALMDELGAKAATTEGQMKILDAKLEELRIRLGEKLLPAVNHFVGSMNALVELMADGNVDNPIAEGWINTFWYLGRVVEIIIDDIRRRFEIMVLDLMTKASEFMVNINNMLPDDYKIEGITLVDNEIQTKRYAYELADRLNDYMRESAKQGDGLRLDDMITINGQQGKVYDLLIGGLQQGLLNDSTVSELFKTNIGDVFLNGLKNLDFSSSAALLSFTDFMQFDYKELEENLMIAADNAVAAGDTRMASIILGARFQLDPEIDDDWVYNLQKLVAEEQERLATENPELTSESLTAKGFQLISSIFGNLQNAGGEVSEAFEGVGSPIDLVNMLFPTDNETFKSELNQRVFRMITEAAAAADEEGLEAAFKVATAIDADIDLERLRKEMEAEIEAIRLSVAVKTEIDVTSNIKNRGGGGTSYRDEVLGRTGGASLTAYHSGGMFYSPNGEGLALLRSGERVLSPDETRRYNQGGGNGVTINYSSFGERPYNALQKLRRAARDAGY